MANVLAVDVGSGSIRVAVVGFNEHGCATVLTSHSRSLSTHSPHSEWYEQSSRDIWQAFVSCVKECTAIAGKDVSAIAFTATCSLVVVEEGNRNDVIMWMDHRAIEEAQLITDSQHPVLDQVGGVCSPEFSVAKLSWLKRNDRERFEKAVAFLELPDYMTWRCLNEEGILGDFKSSNCSLTCKWGYDGQRKQWPMEFYKLIGIGGLIGDSSRISAEVSLPGEFVGNISVKVLEELGLDASQKVAVASSIIDAHAGVLAMAALYSNEHYRLNGEPVNIENVFGVIGGTSTCHMVLNKQLHSTPGVWGPYFDVIFKDYYVREAGQTATGKLLDHVIESHVDRHTIYKTEDIGSIRQTLSDAIKERHAKQLRNSLHVNPCFHGNRSPLANPLLKGGIYGLSLEQSSLIEVYEATIEALAYETRFIVEQLNMSEISAVLVSGGLIKNAIYMKIHADVLGIDVVGLECGKVDMMLAGAAMMALTAAKKSSLTFEHLKDITFDGLKFETYKPNLGYSKYHDLKYKCYKEFVFSSQRMQKIMSEMV
ncbi:FGGY carbohydrate kinase domain-containing protein [Halotydeus destructor]|nr:FGGY carbohydrate kinase domain-containing protein [Halotydeus destructor]